MCSTAQKNRSEERQKKILILRHCSRLQLEEKDGRAEKFQQKKVQFVDLLSAGLAALLRLNPVSDPPNRSSTAPKISPLSFRSLHLGRKKRQIWERGCWRIRYFPSQWWITYFLLSCSICLSFMFDYFSCIYISSTDNLIIAGPLLLTNPVLFFPSPTAAMVSRLPRPRATSPISSHWVLSTAPFKRAAEEKLFALKSVVKFKFLTQELSA